MVYYTYTIPCAFGVIGNFAANQLEDDMTEVIVMESVAYQKMMGQIAKIAEFITKNEHKLQEGDSDNDVWLDSQEKRSLPASRTLWTCIRKTDC